jgi:hypothetical protein
MDPVSIAIIVVTAATAAAGASTVEALRRFVQVVLSREERAGRSVAQVLRDAIRQDTESATPEPTLEERLQDLSGVMAESAVLLEKITNEIDLRAAFAKEKQAEAEAAIAAVSMNREQLEALQRVVRTEVSTEGNRGIRAGLYVALAAFILGVGATVLITLFVHPLHG